MIFTDMYMPGGILGSELAALVRLKEERFRAKKCKILTMSASHDNETHRLAKQGGIIDAFLKKPIQMSEVQQLLRLKKRSIQAIQKF